MELITTVKRLADFTKFIFGMTLVIGILLPLSSSGQNSLVDGLIAYYPLDGDALDLSGNCNHGTVYGSKAAYNKDGNFKTAMSFDGIDDYIEIPHSELFDFTEESDFAISFWVKIEQLQSDADTTDNDLISKWVIDDKSMKHQRNGYPFTFRVINQKRKTHNQIYAAQFGGYKLGCKGSTSLQTKFDMTKDAFTHVLLNVRSGKFYFYLDGELKRRKGSNVFCTIENKAPIRLGKRGGRDFQNHFSGSLDNLAFYNRALSDEEIELLSDTAFEMSDMLKFSPLSSDKILADTLYFDDDIFQLTSAQRQKLSVFTKFLEVGSQYHVIINGHTNGLPSHEFCDVLSLKRAKVIEKYLFEIGISCTKISTVAHGKRDQIASNATPQLRKRNQRAEIVLYKLSKV